MREENGKSWLDDITKTSSDKGLLRASWDVFQDVTSLGGTYQARNLRERVEQEKTRHEEILAQIQLDECLIHAHIVAIGIQLQAAAGTLDSAHALLNPIGGRRKARVDVQHINDGLARRAALKEIEIANHTNLSVMRGTSEARAKYSEGEQKLTREAASLGAVLIVDRKLRRFRLLSDVIRRIRFYFFGYYYTAADMEHVVELERAVDGFMAAFSRRR